MDLFCGACVPLEGVSSVNAIVTNEPGNLARVPELVADFAAAHDLSAKVVHDLNVVLDEVLSNIIRHGYSDDKRHEIELHLSVANGVLEVQIEDDGSPFNPLSVPVPNLSAPLSERPIGGLGIHLIRNFMSEVAYARVGERNQLVLRKILPGWEENKSGSP